jgi:hypothetical protein
MRMLGDLARGFDGEVEMRPQAWRFALLEDPAWYALAMADVVNADMLIIAASSGNELPAAVERWIKMCLARKRGSSAAVVALFGTAQDTDSPHSARFQFVQSAANAAGLDFFAPLPGRADPPFETIESIHRRADTVTRTLDEILHSPAPRWHQEP